MNNYVNKANPNMASARGSDSYAFLASVTDNSHISTFLQEFYDKVQMRAYRMFRNLSPNFASKVNTRDLTYRYSNVIESIFENFMNDFGDSVVPDTRDGSLNRSRIMIINNVRKLTGCSNVNVVFTNKTGDTKGITWMINDRNMISRRLSEHYFDFNGTSDSVRFGKHSNVTLTIIIPVAFVNNMVNKTRGIIKQKLTGESIKLAAQDTRVGDKMRKHLRENLPDMLYAGLVAAVYRESIFLDFAHDTCNVANVLCSTNVTDIEKMTSDSVVNKASDHMKSYGEKSKLNYIAISRVFREHNIDEINPHSLLDVFEVVEAELSKFIDNAMIRNATLSSASIAPCYSDLMLPAANYLDDESQLAANLVHVTKLNYVVIALMMMTKSSVKETNRSKYTRDIDRGIGFYRNTLFQSITSNKTPLMDEVNDQLRYINTLGSDIIKLRTYCRISGKVTK